MDTFKIRYIFIQKQLGMLVFLLIFGFWGDATVLWRSYILGANFYAFWGFAGLRQTLLLHLFWFTRAPAENAYRRCIKPKWRRPRKFWHKPVWGPPFLLVLSLREFFGIWYRAKIHFFAY